MVIRKTKKSDLNNRPYDPQNLKFSFDISKADYKLDRIQEKLLQSYLRVDADFRRAFNINFTSDFLGFLKDKAELHEPVHISITGIVRGGKSSIALTTAIFKTACHNNCYNIKYVCGNAMEYLEKLKSFSQEELSNSIFVVDEIKGAMYNIGSVAKRVKFQDVQNIIAINNISTIMISPTEIANEDAFYLLRVFGRCFKTNTVRLMLYNLQERGKHVPMGMVYLPIYDKFLPEPFSSEFKKQYLEKKQKWVDDEQRGKGDILAEMRKNLAMKISKDKQFNILKVRDEKIAYISQLLGSEYTKAEIEDIFNLTKLLSKGIILKKL